MDVLTLVKSHLLVMKSEEYLSKGATSYRTLSHGTCGFGEHSTPNIPRPKIGAI